MLETSNTVGPFSPAPPPNQSDEAKRESGLKMTKAESIPVHERRT